jgi:hypothetical protein
VLIGDCSGNWRAAGGRAAVQEAPSGTAVDLQPLRRLRGGRFRLPISVRATKPFHALNVELRYDRTQLTLLSARPGAQDNSLARAKEDVPGRVHVALASAEALPGDGKIVLVVEFQGVLGSEGNPPVHVVSAAVDDLSVILY